MEKKDNNEDEGRAKRKGENIQGEESGRGGRGKGIGNGDDE